jgi:hypothetical protein
VLVWALRRSPWPPAAGKGAFRTRRSIEPRDSPSRRPDVRRRKRRILFLMPASEPGAASFATRQSAAISAQCRSIVSKACSSNPARSTGGRRSAGSPRRRAACSASTASAPTSRSRPRKFRRGNLWGREPGCAAVDVELTGRPGRHDGLGHRIDLMLAGRLLRSTLEEEHHGHEGAKTGRRARPDEADVLDGIAGMGSGGSQALLRDRPPRGRARTDR